MKITPLGDYILVKPIEIKEGKTKSGIILPGQASEGIKSLRGEILAFGEGVKTSKLKPGDKILYTIRVKARFVDELYHFIKEEHIVGKYR